MNVDEAIKLGGYLMDYHGLYDWAFVVDTRPLARCGLCNFTNKEIHVSQVHVIDETEEEVKDTILHEIAHALVGHQHHHDEVWMAKCIEIGARPNRLFYKTRTRRFHSFCPTCRKEFQKQRLPLGHKICSACHSKGLPANLYYTSNPKYMTAALQRAEIKHEDKGVTEPVQHLLIQLEKAEGKHAKRIRSQLRNLGHFGGLK